MSTISLTIQDLQNDIVPYPAYKASKYHIADKDKTADNSISVITEKEQIHQQAVKQESDEVTLSDYSKKQGHNARQYSENKTALSDHFRKAVKLDSRLVHWYNTAVNLQEPAPNAKSRVSIYV